MAKSKYDENFPARAGEYAANGLNNREIAARLGISSDSFYVYLRQFPPFAGAVETGRLAVADKTAGSLMDLAMGNCFVTTVKSGDSGHETKTIRRRAPDLNAVIRWLERNRQYADDVVDIADVRNADSVNMNIAANAKFDESFPEQAEIHAGNGDTDSKIAGRLGISLSSFYNYKRQFPAFAVALERGRMECYGSLRCQLLAIALGKCTVTTESYRDGVFRRTTERQLPPNLKAIKYWLAADGCPSGNAGRLCETASAQGPSKVSESGGCPSGNAGRLCETASAQGTSKVSESGGCPSGNAGRMGKTVSAQGPSKVSESADGCPSGNAGRMGKTVSAQGHSKVSESGGCPSGYAGRLGETVSAQGTSKVSESGAASSQSSQSDKHSAQGPSKVSESGAASSRTLLSSRSCKAADLRFAKMSRKERQRLLKNRR